jgi:CxxC motif-containing protein
LKAKEALSVFQLGSAAMLKEDSFFDDKYIKEDSSNFLMVEHLFENVAEPEWGEDNRIRKDNSFCKEAFFSFTNVFEIKLFIRFLDYFEYQGTLKPQYKFLVDPDLYKSSWLLNAIDEFDYDLDFTEIEGFLLAGNKGMDLIRSLQYVLYGRNVSRDLKVFTSCRFDGFWNLMRKRYNIDPLAPKWQCEFMLLQDFTPDEDLSLSDFPAYSERKKLRFALGNKKVFLMNRFAVTLTTLSLILNTYLEQDGFNLFLWNLFVSTIFFLVFGYGLVIDGFIYRSRISKVVQQQGQCSRKCKKMLKHLVPSQGQGRAVYLAVTVIGGQMHLEFQFTPPAHYLDVFDFCEGGGATTCFNRGEIYSSLGYLHYYDLNFFYLVPNGFDNGSGHPLLNASIELMEVPYYHTFLGLPTVKESIMVNAVGIAFGVDCAIEGHWLHILADVKPSFRHCIEAVVSRKCRAIGINLGNQVMTRPFKTGTEKFERAWEQAMVIAEKKNYLRGLIQSKEIPISMAWQKESRAVEEGSTLRMMNIAKGPQIIMATVDLEKIKQAVPPVSTESASSLNLRAEACIKAVQSIPTLHAPAKSKKVKKHKKFTTGVKGGMVLAQHANYFRHPHTQSYALNKFWTDYEEASESPAYRLDEVESSFAQNDAEDDKYNQMLQLHKADRKTTRRRKMEEVNKATKFKKLLAECEEICKDNPYAVRLILEMDLYIKNWPITSILTRNHFMTIAWCAVNDRPVFRNAISKSVYRCEIGYNYKLLKTNISSLGISQ